MGYLQQFFTDVFDVSTQTEVPILSPDDARLKRHLERSTYGDFQLTGAVRPSIDVKVEPSQGFRYDKYVDEECQSEIPVIMVSASKEILFSLFIHMIEGLGEVVDIVLETSHDHETTGHQDLFREHIDMPVLTSMLWDYEDLLTNDGCTGIAVLNPNIPQEVQFDEHKLLIAYGSPLQKFEDILTDYGVYPNKNMKFITEAEHVHSSTDEYCNQFTHLKNILGTCEDFESSADA